MNRMAALRQYRNVNTQSEMVDASPHRLIQLLMEGGLSRIAQARGCMERGELAQKGVLISKAQNQYRVWVQEQADLLVDKTERFVTAYKQGDDAKARIWRSGNAIYRIYLHKQ